ncbi:MAG: AAA-like domain-containing protein [Gloeotrichia echinulata DVL01]|jgi:hypothetical protein|nr:AAA-like domain-containing protein [Gloeotrichia echinulata DEX184]
MVLNSEQAIKLANQAVFRRFHRGLTNVEIIIIQGAWEREEYDEIAVKYKYTTNYISKDVAPKLWKMLTDALGEKVKKNNFKQALQRYGEKQNLEKQFTNEYYLPSLELITVNSLQHNSNLRKATPFPYLVLSPQNFAAPEFYVDRYGLELLCYETLLQPGSLMRIKAPQLMGKTSLMERVLVKMANHGYRIVNLSLEMADRKTHLSNPNKLLRWFCFNLSRELGLPNLLDDYWDEEGMGAKVSCTTYLEEYLLTQADSPLIIYIDDIEALFPYPEVCEDFFGLLRSWYEKARSLQNWKKLRLAIAHTTDVYIRLNINYSPFNMGLAIDLPELTRYEVQLLAEQYGLTGDACLVDPLMQLVGGHPYLLQQAFFYLKNYPDVSLNQFLAEAQTDAGIYRHHLRRYWLSLQQQPELIAAFQTVITSIKPVRLEIISAYKLQSMGLVKLTLNEVEPHCQLYRSYFSELIRGCLKNT